MKSDQLEARMRHGEYFHDLRVLPGRYIAARTASRVAARLPHE
jgi:hypothetical protein